MNCIFCEHCVDISYDHDHWSDDYMAECELVGKDHLIDDDEAKACPWYKSKIESKVLGERLHGGSIMADLGQGIYDAMHKKSKDDDSINWRNELITKGAAVDALGEKPLVWDDLSDFDLGKAAQWSDDIDAIKALPSAQQQWIPVSERLPEEYKDVLCYYEYFHYGDYNCMFRTIDRGYYGNGIWGGEAGQGHKNKVLAWMPLPEPYKEDRMRIIDADALKEKAWDADTRCGYVQVVDVGDIDDAPTIVPEQRWIPVTERLPEDDVEVLVYLREYNYFSPFIAWISKEDGMWHTSGSILEEDDNPIAWMPLPEPYKKGE